jgi:hypothetical protein
VLSLWNLRFHHRHFPKFFSSLPPEIDPSLDQPGSAFATGSIRAKAPSFQPTGRTRAKR